MPSKTAGFETSSLTLGEVLRRATRYLEDNAVETPRLDAELMLAKALGVSRIELYTAFDRPLARHELDTVRALVRRRGRREPLAYVLGEWGFRRLTLKTDARALVPRPETEVVVERCLERIAGLAEPDVLDVGTGTGAIALAIADEHPGARVTAIDNSRDALELARENAAAVGLEARVRLLERDVTLGFGDARFDLVVSNPPYVPPDEIDALQPEIREWEPRNALVGNGALEAVASGAHEVLRRGGWLVLEVGDGQAGDSAEMLTRLGYADVAVSRDLTERERVVEGRWT